MAGTPEFIIQYVNPVGYSAPASGTLTVRPYTARSTIVTWGDLPATVAPTDPLILQKSMATTDAGWDTLVTLTASSVPSWLDEEANNTVYRHGVEYYRLVLPAQNAVIGPVHAYTNIDPIASEIARRNTIRLKGVPAISSSDGVPVYAFVRKRNGVRCPSCWDEILTKRTRAACPVCLDTGFMHGFYDPQELYISFSPESSVGQIEKMGVTNSKSTIQAWTANYPLLASGDVIVEPLNRNVWSITGVDITTHRRVTTKQTLTIIREQGDDPVISLIKRLPGGA